MLEDLLNNLHKMKERQMRKEVLETQIMSYLVHKFGENNKIVINKEELMSNFTTGGIHINGITDDDNLNVIYFDNNEDLENAGKEDDEKENADHDCVDRQKALKLLKEIKELLKSK